MPNIDHHTTHYSCPEKEAEAKRMGTYPVCCHCNNHPCQVDKEIPKAENEVYQPDVNQWWMEEPYCLMDAGNDWISVYDPQAIIAEARRRTLEEVRGIVGDSKTHFYWVGEDPETEETREMDADENSAWGCEMSFAYNAALDSLLSKLDEMK